jgi:divinyl protochlorophyllide a 8-vinyl-reductase
MMTAATPAVSRIGPNAILQVVAAMEAHGGESEAATLLLDATGRALDDLPHEMVDEREVQLLMRELVTRYGRDEAQVVMHDAGVRTADYLLANRIPRPVQRLIRALPRRLGLRVLLLAIGRHAWTFAGSGQFEVDWSTPWPELVFDDCTLCRLIRESDTVCAYYSGTFERLFRVLIAPGAAVREIACTAMGAPSCRFRLHGLDT